MGVYTTNAIMVNQQLVSYIKEQLKNGYDIEAIRNNLLQHGYNRQMVEESIHSAYHKPFPVIPVAVIGVALIVVLGTFLLFSNGKIVCTGTKSEQEVNEALTLLVATLKKVIKSK
jgi:hypothetical protein